MKIFLVAMYPTLSTGYARIGCRITNHLASLPEVEVHYFGFEHYQGRGVEEGAGYF